MSTSLLLSHLQNPNPNVPLTTLIAALSHHLVVDRPTPTQLTAAAVSSPFFLVYPPTHERLQGLVNGFRHAVYLKYQALTERSKREWSFSDAVFSRSIDSRIKDWLKEVLRGFHGGRAIIRLACCLGLLTGIKQSEEFNINLMQVEDEIVIALAEVLDDYTIDVGDWEKEFQPHSTETVLSLTLILAAQSIPLLQPTKLRALPLSLLARLLTSAAFSAFHWGTFLNSLAESPSSLVCIPLSSSFARNVKKMTSSPTMLSMSNLSKSIALVLGTLIDSPNADLEDAHKTLETFKDVASKIEQGWRASRLSAVKNESDIAPDTRELSKSIWLLLKTFLFSTIMVAGGILESVIYIHPQSRNGKQAIAPQDLAQLTLQTLSHISFIVSQFGGVTITASREESGFTELRKVFYLAIDIQSSGESGGRANRTEERDNRCELFVKELIDHLRDTSAFDMMNSGPFEQAQIAYALACVEQLVPLLGASCLNDYVLELCIPYLSTPSNREVYESAHSVVLSIFASHAQQPGQPLELGLPAKSNDRQITKSATQDVSRCSGESGEHAGNDLTTGAEVRPPDSTGFVHRIVPYYAKCLIENSEDGKLSVEQLRLAYAALVRSACTNSDAHIVGLHLGWYCVTLLLDTIQQISPREGGAERITGFQERERLHRLHLTLISTVPSLPLPLMIRALEDIRRIFMTCPRSAGGDCGVGEDVEEERKRKELVDALFIEILERVGDQEKEIAMKWWYTNRNNFIPRTDQHLIASAEEKEMGKANRRKDQSHPGVLSHL